MTDATDRESAWTRLTRRKVVQWGIAYAAGAWGFLQGLGYVSSTFDWPRPIQQLTTLALFVGLPITLVLAWYHGDKGQQRVTRTEFAMLTLLFLFGGVLFWHYERVTERSTRAAAIAPAPIVLADARPSIAVLPFVNMSDDKGNEYFSDGISEELLNVLVRVDGLGVASRTSSFGYKGSPLGTAAIAKALKVNHILEGSVRKSGNHVRITAQLIDALNDRHLWSETYDRDLTDIFSIQEEIANAIVNALRGQLGAAKAATAVTVRADTDNMEAYQLYLKARELFIARSDLKESVQLYEKVVEMDPTFARGWEGLAAVCSILESWGIHDRDYTARAQQAAQRALDLDASLSMPWAVLGLAAATHWPVDWSRNLELIDRAIAADPKNATAYLWRGISWLELGFFKRALADFDRCLELEPNYPNAVRHKAIALLYTGQTDAAIALFERGVAGGFATSYAENFIGPLLQRGDYLAVMLLMDTMGMTPDVRNVLIAALRGSHAPSPEEKAIVERFFSKSDIPEVASLGVSHPFLWLGEFDRVGNTDEAKTGTIVSWDRYPPAFRNSPGFKRRLERNGAVAYWREYGFPPQCHPVGSGDFQCD